MVGKYLQVDPGVEIYYEDVGEGTPIIFNPGWIFTTESFVHQMNHFSETHRVILWDPRSVGRSTTTPHGNNYEQQGADLAKLIEALDLKDVVLVGWSFGCLISWAYVRRNGLDNVKAVVSIDLSPRPLSTNENDWVEGSLEDVGELYNTFLFSPEGYRDIIAAYGDDVMIQHDMNEEELAWVVGMALNTPYYIAAIIFASGMFSDYREEAKLIAASRPALHIIAEHWADVAEPFIKDLCPETQTSVLGGHMMFWEHPEKFNKILEDFLADVE